MTTALEVFSDLSERLRYNFSDFPLYVRSGVLSHFEGYAAACHWHPDLEFVLVFEGSMNYFVNGQIVVLHPGEAIFVNSQRLRYGFSTQETDCKFLVVAIHPSLLADTNPAIKSYVQTKFGPDFQDFFVLHPDTPWQMQTLHSLRDFPPLMEQDAPRLLKLLALAAQICSEIGEHLEPATGNGTGEKTWMTVWKMRSFIHQKYGTKISLTDIAASGAVCRSRCCQLFAQHVGQSPNDYLNSYRLQRSCEMLRQSKRSMIEIAWACGFQSPSYFAAMFRSQIGIAPSAYRGLSAN